MKKILLVTLIGLAIAGNSLFAQTTQTLSLTGPTSWTPGGTVTLSVFDTYSGFGAGSYGLSYWLEISAVVAPYIHIIGATYFTFTTPQYSFPGALDFVPTAPGADPNFYTTMEHNGTRTGDLGAISSPLGTIPDGSYRITDITF